MNSKNLSATYSRKNDIRVTGMRIGMTPQKAREMKNVAIR